MSAFGAVFGAAAQLAEHQPHSIAKMSSVFMLWIALSVTVSLLAESHRHAALLVGFFCLTLVPSFYFTGYLLLPESEQFALEGFMIGWTVFAVCMPLIAVVSCHARGSGLTPAVFRPMLVAVPLAAKLMIFHDLTAVDILLAAGIAYLLFVKKLGRVYNV